MFPGAKCVVVCIPLFILHSTPAQLDADNQWRALLRSVLAEPGLFGIGNVPQGQGIPMSMLMGMDETPLFYIPPLKRTYDAKGLCAKSAQ